MLIEVKSLDDERLATYTRLTEAQLRNRLEPQMGLFIAESEKVILSALSAGLEPVSMLMEERQLGCHAQQQVLQRADVPIFYGSREMLCSLTGYELSRGVLCAMRRPTLPSLDEVCRDKRRIVVADSVVNSTNTGAIFRAAAALGMDGILLTHTCCDPLNRRSVRVSMGTVFQIPWTYIGQSPADWPGWGMQQLHQLGYRTAAMALCDRSISIDDPLLRNEERLAIVLGTEGDGLSQSTLEACDYVVRIPMQNGVDSLNVAAAASVAFWELRR